MPAGLSYSLAFTNPVRGRSLSPQSSPSTESSLLLRVKQRDASAWAQFAEIYGPLIYAWSRRGGLAPEDAADAMQETLLGVAQGLEKFERRGAGSFRAWLWAITTNKIKDHYRRGGNQAVGGSEMLQQLGQLPTDPSDERTDTTAERDLASLLKRGLAQVQAEFEPQTWQAFCLTVIEKQDTSAVAEQLGTSPANVRQARSRVLRRLRQQLGDYLS